MKTTKIKLWVFFIAIIITAFFCSCEKPVTPGPQTITSNIEVVDSFKIKAVVNSVIDPSYIATGDLNFECTTPFKHNYIHTTQIDSISFMCITHNGYIYITGGYVSYPNRIYSYNVNFYKNNVICGQLSVGYNGNSNYGVVWGIKDSLKVN